MHNDQTVDGILQHLDYCTDATVTPPEWWKLSGLLVTANVFSPCFPATPTSSKMRHQGSDDDSKSFSTQSFSLETASSVTVWSDDPTLPKDSSLPGAKPYLDEQGSVKDGDALRLLQRIERKLLAEDINDVKSEEYFTVLDMLRYVARGIARQRSLFIYKLRRYTSRLHSLACDIIFSEMKKGRGAGIARALVQLPVREVEELFAELSIPERNSWYASTRTAGHGVRS